MKDASDIARAVPDGEDVNGSPVAPVNDEVGRCMVDEEVGSYEVATPVADSGMTPQLLKLMP